MAGLLTNAQKAWMTAIVASSLDTTVTIQRPPATPTMDVYGHDISTPTTVGTAQVNVIHPNAAQLTAYAGIIGSKRALFLRFMTTTDIREGDTIVYLGKNWEAHGLDSAESYTFTDEILITTIS